LEGDLRSAHSQREAGDQCLGALSTHLEEERWARGEAVRSLEEWRERSDRSSRMLDNIHRSTSWRLTRPLRSVRRRLHHARPPDPPLEV
ncbi:MAG: hypothetical protein ACRDYE_15710, partial [Acidimicrobiales bacterium]